MSFFVTPVVIYFLNVPVSPYQSGQSVNPAMQRMYDKSNGDIDDLEERLANYQVISPSFVAL